MKFQLGLKVPIIIVSFSPRIESFNNYCPRLESVNNYCPRNESVNN